MTTAYTKFYINGAWVEPKADTTLEVINPATEEPCAVISMGNADDVDAAAQAARAAFPAWSQSSVEERMAVIQKIMAGMQARAGDLASAISAEMGAPMSLATAAQVPSGMGHFAAVLPVLENFEWQETRGSTVIVKEAAGVCGFITPWNWPLNQIACKVAPALAAGCTIVLKPSEVAPINAYILAEIIHEAGLPAGVFNLVNGDGPSVGAAISAHPEIDVVSFTGSTRAGREVAKAAADGIKRVTQELGGKSANIILDDAPDFAKAVAGGVMNCFGNSGQSCNAPTRMLVEASRYDAAVAEATEVAASIKVGPTTEAGRHMGPVVNKTQWEKIQGMIQVGIDEGARMTTGGTGLPENVNHGFYVKPTIFADVTNDMRVAQEEIFGPVLVMIPFKDEADAIRIANDTPYGLTNYVQSTDGPKRNRMARALKAGMIEMNHQSRGNGAPFGGIKLSGLAREGGVWGIEEYLVSKSISGWD